MRNLEFIVIHYTATYIHQKIDMDWIKKVHIKRGWKGPGYHYGINRDGEIEIGRDLKEEGAHVRGYNKDSIGIVYYGGLLPDTNGETGYDTRTAAQKIAIRGLCVKLMKQYPTISRVVGHNNLAATQCPGFDALREYTDLKQSSVHKPSTGVCPWFNTVINGGQSPRNER